MRPGRIISKEAGIYSGDSGSFNSKKAPYPPRVKPVPGSLATSVKFGRLDAKKEMRGARFSGVMRIEMVGAVKMIFEKRLKYMQ